MNYPFKIRRLTAIAGFLYILFATTPVFSAAWNNKIEAILEKASHISWSIQVIDANTEETVFSYYPERFLIPASNVKIVVGAAAILELTPDFKYETKIFMDGTRENGTLNGDLIVVGSGDPSIGGRFHDGDITYTFRQWAQILRDKGIHHITGDVIGIDNIFDEVRRGLNWSPEDYVEWYAAEVSGLTFNDACIDVEVRGASKAGNQANINVEPESGYMQIRNDVTTSTSRRTERGIQLIREPASNLLTLDGSIRVRGRVVQWATVPNPTLFFTSVLHNTLLQQKINIDGKIIDGDEYTSLADRITWRWLHTHESLPFKELLRVCIKKSQNLYAEHFLKTLGVHSYSQGSFDAGVVALKDILFQHGCNLDDQTIVDGSGLSRENRMNASALVRTLKMILDSPYQDIFEDALPVAGVDGTLKRRLRNNVTYKRVKAKTGSMRGIGSLSGIIETQSGKEYIFSMIGNAKRGSSSPHYFIDQMCEVIAAG